MAKPRSRSPSPRKAPTVPAPLTDHERFERCHRWWLCLWLGTTEFLKQEEPLAYAKLCVKLKRHDLINTGVVELDDAGHWRERDSLHGLMRSEPSDALLRRAAAFSADAAPESLRGKTRPRPPAFLMLMAYGLAMADLKKQLPGARRSRESDADLAYQRVADEFGYGTETCRKAIKRARRQWFQRRRRAQ